MYFILLCFLFNPASPNKDNLIDFGGLDYFSSEDFMVAKIIFRSKESRIQLKVKCPKHMECTGKDTVRCNTGQSVQLDLEVTKGISKVAIPFTVFCTADNKFKNANTIQNLEVTHDNKRIYSGWLLNKTGNFSHYFVICMSSAGDIQMIKMTDNVLILTGLKDQTWYQVCVAIVDNQNRKGIFNCSKVLFDQKKFNRNAMYNSYTNLATSNKMEAFSREDILKQKSSDKIIVDLNSSNVNVTVVANGERLNISWEINDGMRGSIFAYILLLKTGSNVCENAIYFVCSDCKAPLNSAYLRGKDQEIISRYKECHNQFTERFDMNQMHFHYVKDLDKTQSNVKEFYAINFLGAHSITLPQASPKGVKTLNSFLLLILMIMLMISVTLLLVYISQRNPSFHFRCLKQASEYGLSSSVTNHPIIESQLNAVVFLNARNSMERTPDNDYEIFNMNLKSKTKTIETAVPLLEYSKNYIQISQYRGAKLIKQFKKLMKESKDQESLLHLTTSKGENANKLKKNRFVNIIPYDRNRVKVGEEEYPGNYINASYIPYDNDANKYEYIATQGPTENTLKEFWQMIWQENVKFIIMLTKLDENNKLKCAQYWPHKIGDHLSVEGFSIVLLDDLQHDGHVERKMIISDEYDCRKKITQFHMNTWLDECAPNIEYFDKFLFRFHEVASNASNHPYLVHCSAGVGRTGTFICIDKIIKNLTKGDQFIDIYETVLMLRRYRMMMVQKNAQYVFIHEYINHFLNKYMIFDQNEEDVYFNDNQWKT